MTTSTDHKITFVPFSERTKEEHREVRRVMGHGICSVCHRVVFITKSGTIKHHGEPVR